MKLSLLRNIGLGFVVAAAGIGGSDVSLAALTGSQYGYALLWAIALGALLKFSLNEGIARWQLATGESVLEGVCTRLGWLGRAIFLVYLLPWTFFVGASLISACGVAASTLAPFIENPKLSKLTLGGAQSFAAVILVLTGGFDVFRRVMGVLTLVMVATVIAAAAMLRPDPLELLEGLFTPRLPAGEKGAQWTLALMGGIGGTVTMLAYGYWIREAGIHGVDRLSGCRLDLACGYIMTAAFGIALTVIAAGVPISSSGEDVFQKIAAQLHERLGPLGRWLYLIGVWCAVVACMLGVWQSVPMLFADWVRLLKSPSNSPTAKSAAAATEIELTRTTAYRAYAIGLGVLPLVGVWNNYSDVQRWFGLIGSAFVPLLAITLLILNNRQNWVGGQARNGWLANAVLALAAIVTIGGLAEELRKAVMSD